MKRIFIAVALSAALGGCATPSEIRRDGTRYDYTLTLPAEKAARCMARNAEEHSSIFQVAADVRPAEERDAFELNVRASGQLIATATVAGTASGAKATIWRYPVPLLPTGLPDAMAKGC